MTTAAPAPAVHGVDGEPLLQMQGDGDPSSVVGGGLMDEHNVGPCPVRLQYWVVPSADVIGSNLVPGYPAVG